MLRRLLVPSAEQVSAEPDGAASSRLFGVRRLTDCFAPAGGAGSPGSTWLATRVSESAMGPRDVVSEQTDGLHFRRVQPQSSGCSVIADPARTGGA